MPSGEPHINDPVDIARKLVMCDSVTNAPNQGITDLLDELLREREFEVERFAYTDLHGTRKFALAARRAPAIESSAGAIGYFCHSDVVSVAGWDAPIGGPFDAVVDGGKLWGRGSCDMKGSTAAALSALGHIAAKDQSAPIFFFVTGDEECGMSGGELIAAESSFFQEMLQRRGVGIIGEPTELRLVTAHKGICHVDVTARGTAAHSSTLEGDNANWKLIPFLQRLKQIDEKCRQAPELQNSAFEPSHLSMNVIVENQPLAANITVAVATCRIFFRPMPGVNWQGILEEILAAADDFQLESSSMRPLGPLHTPVERPAVQEMLQMVGQDQPDSVCYATDGCCFGALDDLIVFGPGSIEQAHRPDEWIAIDQLMQGAQLMQQVFRKFACT